MRPYRTVLNTLSANPYPPRSLPLDLRFADEFTENFNQPERQWDILATPERTSAFLARHGI